MHTKTLSLAIATLLTIGGSAMAQSYHSRDGDWRGDRARVGVGIGVGSGYVQAPGVYGNGYAQGYFYDDAYAYEPRGSVGIYAQEPVMGGYYAQEPEMGRSAQGRNYLPGRSDVSSSQPSHNPALDPAKGSF